MKSLDPFNIDLEKITLIEASAGTGKTYTITTLFCRLIALGYSVESILVVTFTEAAAAELKLRVRTRLFDTLTNLLDKDCRDEDDLIQFLRQESQENQPALICQRFSHALNCFDQSSIMTIHSFCMKVLKEHAFESCSFFDIELVPDRSLFLNQVSHDFFMTNVNSQDILFLSYLNQRQVTPQSFISFFGKAVSRSDLVTIPPCADFENIFDEYRKVLKKIHGILVTGSEEIIELLLNHNGINKRSYTKKNIPAWLEASLKKFEVKKENTLLKMSEKGDALFKFTQTRLAQQIKPETALPEHEFFELCEKLLGFYDVFESNLIHLKIEFLTFFNKELEKMKRAQGICFFDDLVNDLASVLENKDSFNLQKAVRQTYKACLIDEFQDTDPRQYEIFSRFFSFTDNTPFFMIGDPKQAIYAFRGGDIFAYLKASKECDQSFTLKKNYRSAPLLVKGINQIFSGTPNPFLFKEIEFSEVSTPDTAKNFLTEGKKNIPPLQFCFIKRDQSEVDKRGFIKKETASKIIPNIVARDIAALLDSDKRLLNNQISGCEKITPKDIAVLVRTNEQTQQIQKALSDFNIPSYLSKTGSVFDSSQARDLHDILQAVYNPGNSNFIRAALCTSVFGFTSKDIIELNEKQEMLYQWQERFIAFKQNWDSKGFAPMIMALFHHKDAFLKSNPGLDERGMTNFYHLVELISNTSMDRQLSPYYLIKWYTRQLSGEFRDESIDELRLETDKKSVAIVTIHKSKGLEYPIVYLPYLWEGQRRSPSENILFHDPDKEHGLTLDLRSKAGSEDIAASAVCYEKEDKAELRRLLYVALTRASAMCRVFWGGFSTIETSALGLLLHDSDCKDGCKDDQAMINDLEQLKSKASQSVLLEPCVDQSINPFMNQASLQKTSLSAKQVTRSIQASWKMSSFSAIIHNSSDPTPSLKQKHLNQEGLNQEGLDISKKETLITLSDFPKGAGSGDFFHSIFETLDFTSDEKEAASQVKAKFDQFGFSDSDMLDTATASVKEVLETKLVAKNRQFCLKDIESGQKFSEMEFIFPVNSFNIASIIKAFEQSGLNTETSGYLKKLSLLTTHSLKGFIKGFVDLVIQHKGKWYIVDYKSNFLGTTYESYSQEIMLHAMSEHHYFLQYYIYTVALHRYLELRLKDYDYNTHLGGVFYLFIRGMHPEFGSQYGVFHDLPEKSAIIELSNFNKKG